MAKYSRKMQAGVNWLPLVSVSIFIDSQFTPSWQNNITNVKILENYYYSITGNNILKYL
jgi:hypothetical protein